MNKSKLPMPAQIRKKMDKQVKKDIHSASLDTLSTPTSDDTSIEGLLSRLPSKKREKKEALIKSFEKGFELKKKTAKKTSKRTNTDLKEIESSPSHIHTEGQRWLKVTNKQAKLSSKIFNKKSLKKK